MTEPTFKRPELEDKEIISSYFEKAQSRSCERTFVNVYLWSRLVSYTHLFDFQTAVSTASEDVAAECAGGEEQKPKIALTFDDGPNIKYTPCLLYTSG